MRAYHCDTPRRAPRPTRTPTPLTLLLITREKRELGDLVVNRVRSGRASPPPPAALHLLHWRAPSQPRALCEPHLIVFFVVPPQSCRLTRRALQPPRHRAAHLAVVARSLSLRRVVPRLPPSPITYVTRASPARILQPNKPHSKFGVGIADALHIMTKRVMNAWEETPWRTLGGRRVR